MFQNIKNLIKAFNLAFGKEEIKKDVDNIEKVSDGKAIAPGLDIREQTLDEAVNQISNSSEQILQEEIKKIEKPVIVISQINATISQTDTKPYPFDDATFLVSLRMELDSKILFLQANKHLFTNAESCIERYENIIKIVQTAIDAVEMKEEEYKKLLIVLEKQLQEKKAFHKLDPNFQSPIVEPIPIKDLIDDLPKPISVSNDTLTIDDKFITPAVNNVEISKEDIEKKTEILKEDLQKLHSDHGESGDVACKECTPPVEVPDPTPMSCPESVTPFIIPPSEAIPDIQNSPEQPNSIPVGSVIDGPIVSQENLAENRIITPDDERDIESASHLDKPLFEPAHESFMEHVDPVGRYEQRKEENIQINAGTAKEIKPSFLSPGEERDAEAEEVFNENDSVLPVTGAREL